MSKAKESKSTKKISLALQGGGAHGAFTWGVLDRLLEDGRFEIDGVSGTSAGGMNGMSLVQGLMQGGNQGARDSLYKFWSTMSDKYKTTPMRTSWFDKLIGNYSLKYNPAYHMVNFLGGFFSPYQLNPMNANPLKEVIEGLFDFENLRKYKKSRLFLCATHVATGKLKIFTLDGMTAEKVMASACLPQAFQAVEVDGEYYWDGGFIGNPAIYPLIYDCDATDIVVIQLTTLNRPNLPVTAREIHDRHSEITFNSCLIREMRAISYITKLIDEGVADSKKIKRLNMHLIRNEDVFKDLEMSSALNTDWDFLMHLFNQGRKTADAWIKENYDDIGVRSTAKIEKDFVN